jgi:hypothetical protein
MGLIARTAGGAALVVAAAAAYLCFWPVPGEPVAWAAATPTGFTGPFAPNTRLASLRMIDLGGEVGPEHVAIGPDGRLYAAMEGGRLLRMEPDGGKREVFASTGGRVLGFDFDAGGRLIAADAFKGLLAITPDGRVSVLADRVGPDDPIGYADAIVVAPDGTIYFTDPRRASRPRGGAAPCRRACSTSWSNRPPAACWRTIRPRERRGWWPAACPSPTASRCRPTAIRCS